MKGLGSLSAWAGVLGVLVALSARADGDDWRWIFYSHSCTTAEQLAKGKEFVDRAARAGMNGMLVGNLDDIWRQGAGAKNCLRELKAYAEEKGVELVPHCWPIGGYGVLSNVYPGILESTLLKGMPFEAKDDEIVSVMDATPIANPALEEYDVAENRVRGWVTDMPGIASFVDPDGGHDGKPAVRFEPGPDKEPGRHSRLMQKIQLKSGRRYRFSGWVRGTGLHMYFHPIKLQVIPDGAPDASRGLPLAKGDEDWHRLSVEFTTGSSGVVHVYAGSWGATQGKLWLSDFSLEEIGITELSQRKSAPRRLRNAETGVVYREGVDWRLKDVKRGDEVRLERLEGGAIRPGDKLLFDCFVVAHAGAKFQVATCMSDPRLYDGLKLSAAAIQELLRPKVWLLSLDEIMCGGTCELCKVRKTDMAHILGECVTRMHAIIKAEDPDARIFVWSDMFDPNHNARDGVGACRGTFEGVVDLIPKDIGLMLWYGEKLDKSVSYFAARGRCFMGSICCDGKNCEETVRVWKEKLAPQPGLRGFMYTTWLNDYSKVGVFMNGLRKDSAQ